MIKLTIEDSLNSVKCYYSLMIQNFFDTFQTNHVKVK